MIFRETGLEGAYLIEPERIVDQRGFFARTWCIDEFDAQGISADFVQTSASFNEHISTLRGVHFQAEPASEAKLIRCTRGRAYDVMVDLRPDSQTFREWKAFELSADNGRLVYIPEGFGHGFQTQEDRTEVIYQISEFYRPDLSTGVRWDDPDLGITWPNPETPILSGRDHTLPSFREFASASSAHSHRAAG
ncbi:MAG: dTDP-4-dehydrorhamnose 3,5-epimerase [Paracoccaceae bacterium]|jgi:dTDP-4-dehydrorhamnose 3,5-epimerase